MKQILDVMLRHDKGLNALRGGCGGNGQQRPSRHLLCVPDKGALDGVLPFVNGVLLGYPFVYCVSAENVDRACAWLSTTELMVCGCGSPLLLPEIHRILLYVPRGNEPSGSAVPDVSSQ